MFIFMLVHVHVWKLTVELYDVWQVEMSVIEKAVDCLHFMILSSCFHVWSLIVELHCRSRWQS